VRSERVKVSLSTWGEVLHEQVQDDDVDEDVNDRRRSVWL
jgi:hypothetical protein